MPDFEVAKIQSIWVKPVTVSAEVRQIIDNGQDLQIESEQSEEPLFGGGGGEGLRGAREAGGGGSAGLPFLPFLGSDRLIGAARTLQAAFSSPKSQLLFSGHYTTKY